MEYRVLARKYRPSTFTDLIGQEVLVRTLSNAITSGRIAHAFLLTGIRGVGKTTTARIVARALNCIGADGQSGPTITPCGVCTHCRMIAEDRHVDVMEMDAASRTGVGDIRDLIETVHYLPASARYKIYIIDEVHMLSNPAFNALLKTLEEPPPHVKFIFATTEVRKIPVTILSRCQRFDLKRVESAVLKDHLALIAAREGVQVETEALELLAFAAEGSVRDSLSLLDQAMAHGTTEAGQASHISSQAVREMLGMADRAQYFRLLGALLTGDAAGAMVCLRSMNIAGADPLLVMQDLLDITHFITRIKLVPEVGRDISYAEQERSQATGLAGQLSMPVLARLWQMLLKGTQEVRMASSPLAAAEMLLVRIAYAAELPTPAEVITQSRQTANEAPAALAQNAGAGYTPASPSSSVASASATSYAPARRNSNVAPVVESVVVPTASARPVLELVASRAPELAENFEQLVQLFDERREAILHNHLAHEARLVSFEQGRLEIAFSPSVPRDAAPRMAQLLSAWTGRSWQIVCAAASDTPTLHEQRMAAKQRLLAQASAEPLVAGILAQFPGAEVIDVKPSSTPNERS